MDRRMMIPTNEMTELEIVLARANDALEVDEDGLGRVPAEWLSKLRALKTRNESESPDPPAPPPTQRPSLRDLHEERANHSIAMRVVEELSPHLLSIKRTIDELSSKVDNLSNDNANLRQHVELLSRRCDRRHGNGVDVEGSVIDGTG